MVSRRSLIRTAAAAASIPAIAAATPATASGPGVPRAVRLLEEKIQKGMAAYGIPGVSYGLRYQGRDWTGGFGVTDIAAPAPVDADTLFRIASTTKTFTGTAVMRLAENGRLDLDRTIRRYLPSFRPGAPAVTVRQALNHSAGWLGDFFLDTGSGDGNLARYVDAMATLPQLTAPGTVFSYNNAAIGVGGRLIEVATGRVYEDALRALVIDPLRLRSTTFQPGAGASVAVPHGFDADGDLVSVPEALAIPRSLHSFGGLFSTAADQLRWARYHLGDGGPLLTRRSLRAMRWRPGPGGTLFVEIDGAGVTWMLRPTAEGPRVVHHGGDLAGQHSGFMMVPEKDFALTALTNSEGGPALIAELFSSDWALDLFTGLHNLPARPLTLPAARLAPYEGRYVGEQIDVDGTHYAVEIELVASGGRLLVRLGGQAVAILPFHRKDHVLVWGPDGADSHSRADFVRGPDGEVAWLRMSGRLYRHLPAGAPATRTRPATGHRLLPATLPHPARLIG